MCFKRCCGLFLFLVVIACVYAAEYHSIVEKVVYKYPGNVKGDGELDECGNYSVCGVMRLRFWQPPTLHRLCRCVQGSECPWKWAADTSDQFSMQLDNRSQLKFCQKVRELPVCEHSEPSIVVSQVLRGKEKQVEQHKTQVLCRCQWPVYWQLHRNYYHDYFNSTTVAVNQYRCAKLEQCDKFEFCGNVLTETLSTYYRCSCPDGTLCLNKDRIIRNTTELLYQGPTYRAYCLPVS